MTKDKDDGVGVTPTGPGRRPTGRAAKGVSPVPASVPNAAALNVAAGLYMDDGGALYPVTNWIDEDGDECPREHAVTCVAGSGGCWFALTLADFIDGARA